jgi:hypothetical protein
MPLAALAIGAAAGTVTLSGPAGAETTDIARTHLPGD